jgi:signal transduction histidine kinase
MDELKAYVGFTDEDSERLRELLEFLEERLEEVADRFYSAIDRNPDAAKVIRDDAQKTRLKRTLQNWTRDMLRGPHDDDYFERHLNIGRVHVRVGLPQRYVFTAMNVLRTTLGDMCDEQLDLESSTYARRSMSKIMDIELAIMLETYIAEHEREELEEFRTLVFSHLPVTAIVLDEENIVVDVHARHQGLFTGPSLIGHDVATVLRPEFLEASRFESHVRRARSHGNAILLTRVDVLTEPSATYRITFIPVERAYAKVIVHVEDLTEAIATEARRQQQDNLIQLGTMAATVAHEIRNPLAGISGTIQVIERSFEENDRRRPVLGKVNEQVLRLGELVGDLLQFSRPVQSRVERANLVDVAKKAVTGFESDEGNVAEVTGKGEAMADPELLGQVLANLITNGWQAGANTVEVRVDEGALYVFDDGPGIPDEAKKRVFEPFFTTKTRGTGLGLPQAARVVESMGGKLKLKDSPLGGAGFCISLIPAVG